MNEELFSGKADVYKKYRSEYPDIFLDYLYSDLGFSPQSIIADIGAGTGMLSKCLLQRGSRLIFVEPNEDMFNAAKAEFGQNERCVFIKAPAEETTIPSTSVDFVTAARSFHWFDSERFKTECQRILKPDGRVLIIWNNDKLPQEITEETDALSRKYSALFENQPHRKNKTTEAFGQFFKNGSYEHVKFEKESEMNKETFIGRFLSRSYAPNEGEENYEVFVNGLKEIFDRYANKGCITTTNCTECFYGEC